LLNIPIAHRGLWGNGVPENSRTAYLNAAKSGYPIEIDLYLTKDKHLVSFHDATLKRMTGAEGNVWDYTLSELKDLRLDGSDESIPTFEEVLEIARGISPLLIELKQQPIDGMVEQVVERLSSYDGDFAVQSFDPTYILKVKKLAPHFIRGILATNKFDGENLNFFKKKIVEKMLLNFVCKPDFISYEQSGYPLKKGKTKGKALLAWTVTSKEEYDKVKPFVDNVIYEGFDIESRT
ncbi:MAG: glycerophosphodiester phosphodiesterase, partial [Clostridia bacterium]|nr:glycerophosphodiester phosphodiesterase [Clostridia bacterium]